MPSSGSVDYTCNALDIIEDAYSNIGVLAEGQELTGEQVSFAMGKLNRLIKQLSGQADFSPGIKMWSRKRGYLFLQQGQSSYELGPSGDHTATSYVQTTLSVAASGGASSVTLTSVSGVSSGYYIGIVLDSGAIDWTTVNGAPAGQVVTLTATLDGAAAAGNTVFVYSAKMRRPIEIITANLRYQEQDTPIRPRDIYWYEGLNSKFEQGDPHSLYYEAQLTDGMLYLDAEPSDVRKVISFVYISPIEDFDITTDTVDYPQEYYRFLGYQLSMDLSPAYEKPITADLKLLRDESRSIAVNFNAEETTDYFRPGAE